MLAETATVSKVFITMPAPEVGMPLPTDAKTGSTSNTQVTKVEWSGEADHGNMISGKDYIATFTVEIKPDRDAAFSTRSITATVNGSSTGVKVARIVNSKVEVAYFTNPSAISADPLPGTGDTVEHYRMDLDLSMELPVAGVKPADSKVAVDESRYTLLKVEWSGELEADQLSNITRLLLDYPNPDPSYLTAFWSNDYQTCFHNIQEVWPSPKVDAKKFFSDLDAKININASGLDYPFHSSGYLNGKLTIFVPDTQMPKSLLSYSSSPINPPYSVKVYSGDVYEAYKQGPPPGGTGVPAMSTPQGSGPPAAWCRTSPASGPTCITTPANGAASMRGRTA